VLEIIIGFAKSHSTVTVTVKLKPLKNGRLDLTDCGQKKTKTDCVTVLSLIHKSRELQVGSGEWGGILFHE